MGIKVANNAVGVLAAGISDSDVTITVQSGQGARFPALGAGDYFYATLINTSNQLEIVECTARSGDVLTVVRAQEATAARAYDVGDRIEIRITAATFEDATAIYDVETTSTGFFAMPVGTTAQRPASPVSGMIRQNSTTGNPEWYDAEASAWAPFSLAKEYSAEAMIVAGGGGGGGASTGSLRSASGAGAGGMLEIADFSFASGGSYLVIVGAGGAGSSSTGANGVNSSISIFTSTTSAIGGGAGLAGGTNTGISGGSGGGGGSNNGTQLGGSGTSGQGNAGGNGFGDSPFRGGGGGGRGGVGGTGLAGPNGGASVSRSISGSAVDYCGGGGGGGHSGATAGNGGGAGAGAGSAVGNGASASIANRGSGGGGGAGGVNTSGGNGSSGVVIFRYEGAQRGTGGTVTSAGGFTIHTFTSSGTYTA